MCKLFDGNEYVIPKQKENSRTHMSETRYISITQIMVFRVLFDAMESQEDCLSIKST